MRVPIVALLASVLGAAQAANQACPVACDLPSGLEFCAGVVDYRTCSESFVDADREAQRWANATGLLSCEAGRRVACLSHFSACEISTDTRALCRADCEEQLASCSAAPGACTAAGSHVADADDKCFDASYVGEPGVVTGSRVGGPRAGSVRFP